MSYLSSLSYTVHMIQACHMPIMEHSRNCSPRSLRSQQSLSIALPHHEDTCKESDQASPQRGHVIHSNYTQDADGDSKRQKPPAHHGNTSQVIYSIKISNLSNTSQGSHASEISSYETKLSNLQIKLDT